MKGKLGKTCHCTVAMPLDHKTSYGFTFHIPSDRTSLLFDHHRVIASGVIPLDSVFLVIGSYFFVPTYVSGNCSSF